MDWRVVAFTVSVSIVTVICVGPAARADHVACRSERGDQAGGAGLPRLDADRHTSRSILVVAEIGLAVVLLIGAGLLIKTIGRAERHRSRRQRERRRRHAHVAVGGAIPRRDTARVDLVRSTLDGIRALPGVVAAGATCCVPLQRAWGEVFKIVGRDDGRQTVYRRRRRDDQHRATTSTSSEVPVVRGRVFAERDDAGSTPVIVINRALADRWWPNGQDPIGQKIRIGGGHDEPEREVIGIVENVRQARLELVRAHDVRSVRADLRHVAQDPAAGRLARVDRSNAHRSARRGRGHSQRDSTKHRGAGHGGCRDERQSSRTR